MGRGDHAHIDLAHPGAADRPDLALLQHAEQAGLDPERHVADLVEEQRATIGLDEHAGALGGGARERAFAVAEQLAVDQRVGDRAAVERHEPARLALAAVVQGACDELLTGAALTLDQDRHRLGREPVERGVQPADRGRRAHEQVVAILVLALELTPQRRVPSGGGDHRGQLERAERLGDVVKRTRTHTRRRGRRGVVPRQHDHRGQRIRLAEPLEQVEAIDARQTHIHHDDIPRVGAIIEPLHDPERLVDHLDVHPVGGELAGDHPAKLLVILDDEHLNSLGLGIHVQLWCRILSYGRAA